MRTIHFHLAVQGKNVARNLYSCGDAGEGDHSGVYVQVEVAQDLLRAAEMYRKALEMLIGEAKDGGTCTFPTAIAVVTARDHGAKILDGLK